MPNPKPTAEEEEQRRLVAYFATLASLIPMPDEDWWHGLSSPLKVERRKPKSQPVALTQLALLEQMPRKSP